MPSLASSQWGTGPLLVLCHGFTQRARSWGRFGELLGEDHTVLALEMPGHGGSADVSDLEEAAELIGAATTGEPFDLLGYSMGGRAALATALQAPAGLSSLVLIGATPGIDDATAREARRQADRALAEQLDAEGDVSAFLDRWLAQPIFATLQPTPADRQAREENTAAGLAASLRSMGTGAQAPRWSQLDTLRSPTLLLVGVTDDRFVAIARRMAERIPDATIKLVPGAGHACHLEQPELAASMVHQWLARSDHAIANPSAKSTPTAS